MSTAGSTESKGLGSDEKLVDIEKIDASLTLNLESLLETFDQDFQTNFVWLTVKSIIKEWVDSKRLLSYFYDITKLSAQLELNFEPDTIFENFYHTLSETILKGGAKKHVKTLFQP